MHRGFSQACILGRMGPHAMLIHPGPLVISHDEKDFLSLFLVRVITSLVIIPLPSKCSDDGTGLKLG